MTERDPDSGLGQRDCTAEERRRVGDAEEFWLRSAGSDTAVLKQMSLALCLSNCLAKCVVLTKWN